MVEEKSEASTHAGPPWWFAVWEFLVHAFVGTALFLLIAFPAIGLNLLTHYLQETLNPSLVVIYALLAVEYILLATDLVLFVVFMIRSAARTIRLL